MQTSSAGHAHRAVRHFIFAENNFANDPGLVATLQKPYHPQFAFAIGIGEIDPRPKSHVPGAACPSVTANLSHSQSLSKLLFREISGNISNNQGISGNLSKHKF